MTPQEKLIATAVDQIGYLGHRTNAQLDSPTANGGGKYNKFARDLDAMGDFYNGPKQGFDWCFTAGTLILTENGYKKIEDIHEGDSVLGAFGDRFNTVTNVCAHEAPIVKLSAYGTVPMTVTKDHPFLSKKRVSKFHRPKGFTSFGFNRLESLQKNDMVAVPKTPAVMETGLTLGELWAVGYYVGDGYKYRDHYILCGNENKINAVSQHIDIIPEKRKYASRTCHQVKINVEAHGNMVDVLEDCGSGAINKRVPHQVLFATDEEKVAFLSGYLHADGSKINGTYGFNTVSKELAIGLSRIIFDLGLGCSIVENKREPVGRIFDKRIGKVREFKQQEVIFYGKINASNDPAHQRHVIEESLSFVPIKTIGDCTETDTVYTITTDGDHTYTANNLAVHNCDIFVDWCFVQTFGRDLAQKLTFQPNRSAGAGTAYSLGYYRSNGHFSSTPQVGDQIFFGDSKSTWHTGIVTRVTGGTVCTVEGNSGSPLGVHEFRYQIGDKRIKGYGRPYWSLVMGETPPAAQPSAPPAALKIGDIVEFTGTQHYSSANGTTSFPCKAGSARVTQIANGARHPYHLIHTGAGCTVYGWVNAEDIKD